MASSLLRASIVLLLLAACEPTSVDSDAGHDAARPDAAVTDASADAFASVDGGSDAGHDTGPPGCGHLFCEDFEGDVTSRWTEVAGYDAMNHATIETDRVAHGTHAMHAFVSENGGGFAYLQETTTFPALADGMWGRASFYTSVATTSGHSDFIDAVAGTHTALEVGYGNGTWQLTQYPAAGGENPAGYPAMVPRNAWTCLEWHFQRISPQIEVFIDGVSVARYARDGLDVPALTALKLGFGNHSANAPTNESFFDDVVLDTSRIGCP